MTPSPDLAFLERCVEAASRNATRGEGGPFAALIAKDGVVVAEGHNQVLSLSDPTAHAEVQAIRAACRALGTFQLSGCVLYTSCEPCPMCLGAIYWARPDRVYFAARREDAAAAGFDDKVIYDELPLPGTSRRIPCHHVVMPKATNPFATWLAFTHRVPY